MDTAAREAGIAHYRAGRHPEAEALLRLACKRAPEDGMAHFAHGCALRALHDPRNAEKALRRSVALLPHFAEAHLHLGMALRDLGQDEPAIACYDTAIALNTGLALAWNLRGLLLSDLERFAEAAESFAQAARLEPSSADAFLNLGNALKDQDRFAEAEAALHQALALNPDSAIAHFNLAHILLLTGRFSEGWNHYEWRWKLPDVGTRAMPRPLWHGEEAHGKVLLLWAEQGLGDTIQFCRYASLAAHRARVVLEVQRPLVRLLDGIEGVEKVVARGEAVPEFDLHCPLLALPDVFGTTCSNIPARDAYIHADSQAEAAWRRRLGEDAFNVGLVWAGGARPVHDGVNRQRSLSLDALSPLGSMPEVRFVSVQKGDAARAARRPPAGLDITDWTDELHDFADTAALVAALDLVISVDTAVAHLAGALGKPVWLLNRADTDWRWLLGRSASPWYPSMRIFRQHRRGEWDSVLGEVRSALAAAVLRHRSSGAGH